MEIINYSFISQSSQTWRKVLQWVYKCCSSNLLHKLINIFPKLKLHFITLTNQDVMSWLLLTLSIGSLSKVASIVVTSHEAGKHRHYHLWLWLHNVFRKGVYACTYFTSQANGITSICKSILWNQKYGIFLLTTLSNKIF